MDFFGGGWGGKGLKFPYLIRWVFFLVGWCNDLFPFGQSPQKPKQNKESTATLGVPPK